MFEGNEGGAAKQKLLWNETSHGTYSECCLGANEKFDNGEHIWTSLCRRVALHFGKDKGTCVSSMSAHLLSDYINSVRIGKEGIIQVSSS